MTLMILSKSKKTKWLRLKWTKCSIFTRNKMRAHRKKVCKNGGRASKNSSSYFSCLQCSTYRISWSTRFLISVRMICFPAQNLLRIYNSINLGNGLTMKFRKSCIHKMLHSELWMLIQTEKIYCKLFDQIEIKI